MNIQLTKYLERLYQYESKKKPKKYKIRLINGRKNGSNTNVYELEVL